MDLAGTNKLAIFIFFKKSCETNLHISGTVAAPKQKGSNTKRVTKMKTDNTGLNSEATIPHFSFYSLQPK